MEPLTLADFSRKNVHLQYRRKLGIQFRCFQCDSKGCRVCIPDYGLCLHLEDLLTALFYFFKFDVWFGEKKNCNTWIRCMYIPSLFIDVSGIGGAGLRYHDVSAYRSRSLRGPQSRGLPWQATPRPRCKDTRHWDPALKITWLSCRWQRPQRDRRGAALWIGPFLTPQGHEITSTGCFKSVGWPIAWHWLRRHLPFRTGTMHMEAQRKTITEDGEHTIFTAKIGGNLIQD